MKTDPDSHASGPDHVFLLYMNRLWVKKQSRLPLPDYDKWQWKNKTRERLNGWINTLLIIFALSVAPPLFHYSRWAWLSVTIASIAGIAIIILGMKMRISFPYGAEPTIWKEYESDLKKIIEMFGLVDPSALPPDIIKIISDELNLRAAQIWAKQKLGFGVDARKERQSFLVVHGIADKFGLAQDIKHYFPPVK